MSDLSIRSQYLLCPPPRECEQSDFTISEFNTQMNINIELVPANSYCRVRIFTTVSENYKVHMANIEVNQATIEVFQSDPRPSQNFNFASFSNFSASTTVEFTANVNRRNNLFMVLTPGVGLEGRVIIIEIKIIIFCSTSLTRTKITYLALILQINEK